MNDDARDLAAAKAGDEQAFGRLYDRHAAVVLSLCRGAAASLHDADDACQETFIRAFQRVDQVDSTQPDHAALRNGDPAPGGGLRSWLYAIARRVCSERRRAHARRGKHEGHAMVNAALMDRHRASEPRTDADQLDQLTRALDRLDDRERLAIHLHYLDADPASAAEDALGLSRSAYYKLVARARQRIASLMAQEGIEASRHQVEDPPRRGIKAMRNQR